MNPGLHLYTGTSGYAYKEWKGTFYPADCRPDAMLAFYAGHLSAVEINNTFYRMPTDRVLAGWAAQVPETFRFVLKASQRITHMKRLAGVEDDLAYFLQTATTLGVRRGPTLFQLPPNLKKDLPRLQAFLDLLPRGWQAAFEFRHASWFDDDVYALLHAHGVALCLAESDEGDPPRVATGPFGYLRLRREAYDRPALDAWAAWVRAQNWNDAYVFFKHEGAGTGAQLAMQFAAL